MSEKGCSSYKHSYNLLRDWGVRRIIYMIWVLLDLTMTSTRLRVYLKWQDRWAASQIATQHNLAKHNLITAASATGQPE